MKTVTQPSHDTSGKPTITRSSRGTRVPSLENCRVVASSQVCPMGTLKIILIKVHSHSLQYPHLARTYDVARYIEYMYTVPDHLLLLAV